MTAQELSLQLWRERGLLETLLFKLDEQQMLVASGRTRWIPAAVKEVERVVEVYTPAAIQRDMLVEAVAEEWGVPGKTSLRELIEAAPNDVWKEVLESHLTALTTIVAEIQEMREINEQRIRAALRVTQETIAGLEPTGEYDTTGDVVREGGSRILDTRA